MTELEEYMANYSITSVDTAMIQVEPDAQRDVEERTEQFDYIMKHFDKDLVRPLILSMRDNKLYCIDGQMTRKVLINKNGGHLRVPCRILYGLNKEQEAQRFLLQDGTKAKLTRKERTAVELKNAIDPETNDYISEEAKEITKICEILAQYGIKLSIGSGKSKNTFSCDDSLRNQYRASFAQDHTARLFDQTIRIIKEAWDGSKESMGQNILKGMGLFVRTYTSDPNFSETYLIDKLKRYDPQEVLNFMKNQKDNPYAKEDTFIKHNPHSKYAYPFFWIFNNKRTRDHRLDDPNWEIPMGGENTPEENSDV